MGEENQQLMKKYTKLLKSVIFHPSFALTSK